MRNKIKVKEIIIPNKINAIHIKEMWDKFDVDWQLDPKVNILGGINGSGKTTLLNIIGELISGKINGRKKAFQKASIQFDQFTLNYPKNFKNNESIYTIPNFAKIDTFDMPVKDKRKISTENTYLDVELRDLIDGNSADFNFVKLHSKIQTKTIELYEQEKIEEAKIQQQRVIDFFSTIDTFFSKTNKRIVFTEDKNIVFLNGNRQLKTNQLSSGEKQLLVILFQVFLQEEQPYILLLDEPEISLHLNWQFKLIETIQNINPNCQLIIATHSPAIFGEGWGDKVVDIESLKKYEDVRL